MRACVSSLVSAEILSSYISLVVFCFVVVFLYFISDCTLPNVQIYLLCAKSSVKRLIWSVCVFRFYVDVVHQCLRLNKRQINGTYIVWWTHARWQRRRQLHDCRPHESDEHTVKPNELLCEHKISSLSTVLVVNKTENECEQAGERRTNTQRERHRHFCT